jgi:hypothetical protein
LCSGAQSDFANGSQLKNKYKRKTSKNNVGGFDPYVKGWRMCATDYTLKQCQTDCQDASGCNAISFRSEIKTTNRCCFLYQNGCSIASTSTASKQYKSYKKSKTIKQPSKQQPINVKGGNYVYKIVLTNKSTALANSVCGTTECVNTDFGTCKNKCDKRNDCDYINFKTTKPTRCCVRKNPCDLKRGIRNTIGWNVYKKIPKKKI